ncbi:MAG: lipid II flippase MurJ [Candidatus Taylorbacteria bacterium]
MVKHWFSFIGKEIRGLHEAAYLLASFAFLSLILALVRDKLLAYTFGAGHAIDVYYAAFRIPDLIFATVGSLVSASIILPYFIEKFEASKENGKTFSDGIFTIFFSLMIVVSIIVFFLAPWLVPKLLPGFVNDPALSDLILSVRIMLLSPFFLGLSNLLSCLTQMNHRFLVYAASPVVYNAGIILGVLVGYPLLGISGLAWGVAIGAFLHMGIQIPFLLHEKLFPKFTFDIAWRDIKKIVFTTLPRTVTLSANQLASFVLVSLASLMSVGSISVFNFAFNLQSVSLTLVGASYSSAVFPTLSRMLFKGHIAEFKEKMIASAQHIIFWSMPITILFIVLRAQIVRTVLGAGKFDWADTRLTAAMLAIFAVSTIGQSLIVLFVRSFYAEGKTARPLVINVISAVIIVFSGYFLDKAFFAYPVFRYFIESMMKVEDQVGTSVLVLALAFTFGVIVNTILHWWTYEKVYKGFTKPVFTTLFQTFSASVIMGYVSFQSLRFFALFLPLNKAWGIFLQGLFAGLLGLVVFVFMLILLKNKELSQVWFTLHKKIWKVSVPPAEVEHL